MNKAPTMDGARILLIDPSEKGAMPLYTSMVAQGLNAAGLRPIFLANWRLTTPSLTGPWKTKRWLPAARWPRPPGSKPVPLRVQGAIWFGCAIVIIMATILFRPRVVHFQHPIHPKLDVWLIKILKRLSTVAWTAHDVIPHDPAKNVLERAARLYRAVDVVIVHSRPAADEVMSIAGVSAFILDHPVRTIDNVPDRRTARKDLGLDQTIRVVGAIGFIRAYKGYQLLAEIWEQLGDRAPLLLLLGELVDASEMLVIQRLKACSNTDIRLGYASDEDVISAMAAADIIVLPHAKGSDSGSLHVARAVGTPVLSSNSPQLASVVEANGAGVVLPRDAALWAAALVGPLPPPPPAPPEPVATGKAHWEAYLAKRG